MKTAMVHAIIAMTAFVATQTHAQADAGTRPKAAVCEACHGLNGNSTDPQYPILAGQSARYIQVQLEDYKAGQRHGASMQPIAESLSAQDMLALADYFSQQPKKPIDFNADPAKAAAGQKKSEEMLCTTCHAGEFMGQNEILRVAGQHYAYIKKSLTDFKTRNRTNDAGNMTSVASSLSDQDIDNLAQYIAIL